MLNLILSRDFYSFFVIESKTSNGPERLVTGVWRPGAVGHLRAGCPVHSAAAGGETCAWSFEP